MRTGLFGGTFDPIHKGHLTLAESLIEKNILDKVIFVVTHIPPHKNSNITEDIHRFNMVSLAVNGKFEVSDYEIKKGGKSYSFDTLSYFSSVYKEDEIFFIIGADMVLDLPNWYKAKELMENFSFIAVDRENTLKKEEFSTLCNLKEKYNAKITLTDIKTPFISSTHIRNKLQKGEDVSDLVDEKVIKYIKDNNLYD